MPANTSPTNEQRSTRSRTGIFMPPRARSSARLEVPRLPGTAPGVLAIRAPDVHGDVSLVGFDDVRFGSQVCPPLLWGARYGSPPDGCHGAAYTFVACRTPAL